METVLFFISPTRHTCTNRLEGICRYARTQGWYVQVVEGDETQKTSFYTSLYHLFIQPSNIADAGEKPFYSTFSLWDTFRAANPLYTILAPEKVEEFVDSLLEQGRRTGYLPLWTLWGKENQCMIGTHSIPVIVDWFLKEVGDMSSSSRKEGGKRMDPLKRIVCDAVWQVIFSYVLILAFWEFLLAFLWQL